MTAPRVGNGRSVHPPPFLGLHVCNKMDAWPMDGPILLHARAYLITRRRKNAWEGDIRQTDGHRDSMIQSAQLADLMKIE